MKPILFADDETNFTINGLGRLDCISCIVTEERNGVYECEMEVSASSAHASEIAMNSIIGVIPCDGGSLQAFRVYEISKPIHGRFKVYARHISYDLTKIPCMPFSVAASPSAAASTLAGLKSHAVEACPFTFWTDLTTASSYKQTLPASIRQRLGGVEGSVLDQFGGEYEWDNYTVKLHKQRGSIDTGITLRYGKNITDINQEENIAATVTGVVPYWSDMDGVNVVTLPEHVVYSTNADRYPFHLTEVLDLSGKWEEEPSVNSLRLAAQAYVNKSGLGIPKVSIEVSFVELWQTEEYKEVAPLQRVKLCDEVTVEFEKLGISETAKIVRTEYDVLAERYKSVTLGNLRSTFVSTLNDQNASTLQTIDLRTVQISDAINQATAWLASSNGYLVAVKNQDGSWKELLAMDTNDPEIAQKVMRLNENGLGGSSTGIDGPYVSAILSDGTIVATRIATGILQDHYGKFVLNLETGALTIGGSAKLGDDEVTLTSTLTKINATETGLSSEVIRAQTAEGALSAVYSGTYVPTASNSPASSWNTTELKQQHINDLFYNTETGDSYMWKEAKGGVIITFDAQSATESTSYDYVEVYYYDSSAGSYKYTKRYGGKGNSNTISGLRLFVPSNSFYVHWKTDSSVVDWGFKVIKCEAAACAVGDISTLYPNSTSSLPRSVTSTISGTSTMPETDHDYASSDEKLWQWNTQVTIPTGTYNWAIQASVSTAYSQIKQTADQISLKVSKGDVSSQLSVESGQITLASGRLVISAGNFQLNSQGTMTCTNANISGTITLGKSGNTSGTLSLYSANNSTVRLQLTNEGMITHGTSVFSSGSTFRTVYGYNGYLTRLSSSQWFGDVMAYYKNDDSTPFGIIGIGDFDGDTYPYLVMHNNGILELSSRDAIRLHAATTDMSKESSLYLSPTGGSIQAPNLSLSSYQYPSATDMTLSGAKMDLVADTISLRCGTLLIGQGQYSTYSGEKTGNYYFKNGIACPY